MAESITTLLADVLCFLNNNGSGPAEFLGVGVDVITGVLSLIVLLRYVACSYGHGKKQEITAKLAFDVACDLFDNNGAGEGGYYKGQLWYKVDAKAPVLDCKFSCGELSSGLCWQTLYSNCCEENTEVSLPSCNAWTSVALDNNLSLQLGCKCKYNLDLGLTIGTIGSPCGKFASDAPGEVYTKWTFAIDKFSHIVEELALLNYPNVPTGPETNDWFVRASLKQNANLWFGFNLNCGTSPGIDIFPLNTVSLQIPFKLDARQYNFLGSDNAGINLFAGFNAAPPITLDNLGFQFVLSYHSDLDCDGIAACLPKFPCTLKPSEPDN